MTRTILAGSAFTLAALITVGAQTPPPPTQRPAPRSPGTTAQADTNAVTVTGCLKAWDAAMPPAGGVPAGAAAGRFLLTNVKAPDAKTPDAKTPEAAATPGAGATTMSAADTQYVVTAEAGVNLAAHVNHQVRITGKTTASPATGLFGTSKPEAAPAQPTTTDAGARADKWATLSATSITMVASACTGATN